MIDNPFGVPGIRCDAGEKKIQAAFRRLVKRCHPDIAGNSGEEFCGGAGEGSYRGGSLKLLPNVPDSWQVWRHIDHVHLTVTFRVTERGE